MLSALVAASDSNRVTGGASYSYAIEVASLQNDYLPMPYPVSEVNDVAGLDSDWRMDPATGIAFSDNVPATGLSYQVAALDPRGPGRAAERGRKPPRATSGRSSTCPTDCHHASATSPPR